jgi:hypothetical protein
MNSIMITFDDMGFDVVVHHPHKKRIFDSCHGASQLEVRTTFSLKSRCFYTNDRSDVTSNPVQDLDTLDLIHRSGMTKI